MLLHWKTGEMAEDEPVAFVLGPAEAGDAMEDTVREVRAAFALSDTPPPSLSLVADVVVG